MNETLEKQKMDLQLAIADQIVLLQNNHSLSKDSSSDLSDSRGLMKCYHDEIVNGNHVDIPDTEDEAQELVIAANCLSTLTDEVDWMKKLIPKIEIEIKALDQELADNDRKVISLRDIMERRKTKGEMNSDICAERKLRIAKKLQRTQRGILENMIAGIFNDEDQIRGILQELTTSFFKGANDYIQVADNGSVPILAMLLDARIIKRNPYDSNQIKLTSAF